MEDTLMVGEGGTTLLPTKWSSEDANQRASYDRYPYGTINQRDIGYTTTRIKGIPTNNSTEKKGSSWNQTETELE
jgi:hypothetical protein